MSAKYIRPHIERTKEVQLMESWYDKIFRQGIESGFMSAHDDIKELWECDVDTSEALWQKITPKLLDAPKVGCELSDWSSYISQLVDYIIIQEKKILDYTK